MVNEAGIRALATIDIILGCLVMIVQISTLSTLYEWVDFIAVGIWGGSFMMSAGALTMRKHPRLISTSVFACVGSGTMLIVYSINLAYVETNSYWCHYQNDYQNEDLCEWRTASDIIFIVCGSIGILLNAYLSYKAKSIVVPLPAQVVYPMRNYGRPVVATTTYVTTTPMNTYPPTQQVIYQTQPGVYQTQAAVYQTEPATYPANGAVMYQQQPVPYSAQQASYPPATAVVEQPNSYPRY